MSVGLSCGLGSMPALSVTQSSAEVACAVCGAIYASLSFYLTFVPERGHLVS